MPRTGVVNGVRNKLLAGARLPLDKYGGVRRRDVCDLFEHRFQRRTAAYDLLKSTRGKVSIANIQNLGCTHSDLPPIWFRTLSMLSGDPFPDVCGAILELNVVRFTAPEKADNVLIHQRQVLQIQDDAA